MDWTDRIKLRHLRIIQSLARTLNLSRTAREVNSTQPGISKWLRDLETELGVELFDRHAKGIAINRHGRALLHHAERINVALDLARDEMAVLAYQGAGLVSIGIAGASSIDAVPMAVTHITKQMPDAQVRLIENTSVMLLPMLHNGMLDILVGERGLNYDNTLIREEPLYDDPICLVARCGHPLDTGKPVSWQDVLDYPLAVWANGTPIRAAFDRALNRAGIMLPPTYLESNSASINLNLLLNSDMIGVSMQRPAERYRGIGALCIIPLSLGEYGSIAMYLRNDAIQRPVVAAAINGLRKSLADTSSELGVQSRHLMDRI